MTLCLWAILLHVSTEKSSSKIPRRKFWKYSLFLYIFHSMYCPLISSVGLIMLSILSTLPGSSHVWKSLKMTQGVIWVFCKDGHAYFYIPENNEFSCLVFNIIHFVWFVFVLLSFPAGRIHKGVVGMPLPLSFRNTVWMDQWIHGPQNAILLDRME